MKKKRILGLDILPSRHVFYGVIINEKGIKLWEGKLSRNEILKIIEEYRVTHVGTDNIFELFPHTDEIIQFIRKTHVKLVQVTGPPNSGKKLYQIANELGIRKGGKLSPRDAAIVSAILVLKGFGAEVSVFEDLTEIIISRTRSLGEGGQHQSKYARMIAAAIQSATSEVEDKLRQSNLKYDLFRHEGDFGLKNAKFIVYASYDAVKKVIKDYHGSLFRIEIRPIEKKRLAFLCNSNRISSSTKYLICGIDPGETIGLAILDLKGNIIKLLSRKFMGISEIIEEIYAIGKPVILATDVPKTPQLIEYLARKTGAIIVTPDKHIPISEKNSIINELGVRVSNSHERDALVAAIFALNKYKPQFQKVDKIISYLPIYIKSDLVKRDIVFGESIKNSIQKHFWNVLNDIITRKELRKTSESHDKDKKLLNRINILSKKLADTYKEKEQLIKRINDLENELHRKDIEISRLRETIANLRDFRSNLSRAELERIGLRKIRELESRIDSLLGSIRKLKSDVSFLTHIIQNLHKIINKGENEIVIKKMEQLSQYDLEYLEKYYTIQPNDVIYVKSFENPSVKVLRYLGEKGISIIIARDDPPEHILDEIEKLGIELIYLDEFPEDLQIQNDILIIQRDLLYKALREAQRRAMSEEDALYDYVEEILDQWKRKRIEEMNKRD